MPMRLIYQLLELLDHVTQLMRLLERNKKRRREREDDVLASSPVTVSD